MLETSDRGDVLTKLISGALNVQRSYSLPWQFPNYLLQVLGTCLIQILVTGR
jgi:hypothetical protein